MKTSTRLATVACYIALLALPAEAASIKWVLNDVAFDDGGAAFGSFFFDADTNTYSNISITTTAGSVRDGAHYELLNPDVAQGGFGLRVVTVPDPMAGDDAFNLNFDTVLTNAGGSVALALAPPPQAFESQCLFDICSAFSVTAPRDVIAGSVSAVPIPAAVWLFGSVIASLGFFRRRT